MFVSHTSQCFFLLLLTLGQKSQQKKLINFFNFKFILFTLLVLELNDDRAIFFHSQHKLTFMQKKLVSPKKLN